MKLKDIRGLELPIEYSKIILEPAIKIEKTVEPVSIQYEDDIVYNTNKMGFTK